MDAVIRDLEGCLPRPVHRATLVSRAAAATIDLLAIVGIGALADLLFVRGFGAVRVTDTVWGPLVLSLAFAVYHVASEARWGATLGKYMLGIRVVSVRGMRAPTRALVPRFALRYPVVVIDLVLLGGITRTLVWVSFLLQFLVIAASVASYVFMRQRSVSDLLTKTRVAVRLDPEDEE
jgi:uncharacterized RDD family membrane protein YckC